MRSRIHNSCGAALNSAKTLRTAQPCTSWRLFLVKASGALLVLAVGGAASVNEAEADCEAQDPANESAVQQVGGPALSAEELGGEAENEDAEEGE